MSYLIFAALVAIFVLFFFIHTRIQVARYKAALEKRVEEEKIYAKEMSKNKTRRK